MPVKTPLGTAALKEWLESAGAEDQRMRSRLARLRAGRGAVYQALKRKVACADRSNQTRLMRIIEATGWPSRSLVGSRATTAAFALATHLPSINAQRRCIKALRKALKLGEACGFEFAFLVDRVRVRSRQKQVYATHLVVDTETRRIVPFPTRCIGAVDARRRALGICTLRHQIRQHVKALTK